MIASCHIKNRLYALSLLLAVAGGSSSTLEAVDGQLQFFTYYDSNVYEALAVPNPTLGLTLRGRLSHELSSTRQNIAGELLSQVNLDTFFPEESKLLVNAELGYQYRLSSALFLHGQLSHFRKWFYYRAGSYTWIDYDAFLQLSPSSRYSGWFGYRHRQKTLAATERFRFSEDSLELRGRYNITARLFLEGTVTGSHIIHSDFYAVGVVGDTDLVILGYPQEDRGMEGILHLRYWGKAIIGVQVEMANIHSNSAIGAFSSMSFHAYMSGQLGSSTFYHIVFRLIDKDYKSPDLGGESRYRDPEEAVQNLAHIRLEQVLGGNSIGYLQLSRLQNETIFNQRYYDKTMIEIGLKYEL